jgi:hypothetical protein
MTWNKSERELINFLDDANTWRQVLEKIVAATCFYKPSRRGDFFYKPTRRGSGRFSTSMDISVTTSVYHKPAAESYVVPFISDHPRHVFGNIIQNDLTRTVRYSLTFQAFQNEQRYIKLMLLYNG